MKEEVAFCPQCGSARVDVSVLVGGKCQCRTCEWSGTSDDLFYYQRDVSGAVGIDAVTRYSYDVRNTIARETHEPIGKLLLRWGFIDEKVDPHELGRYLNAIARVTAIAIVETRDQIAAEKKNDRPV